VAVVLAIGDSRAATVISELAALGVTTVGRAFDADAPRIIAALTPDILVMAGQPLIATDAEAIRLGAAQDVGQLLVVDTSGLSGGLSAALDAGADQCLGLAADPGIVRATLSAMLRRSVRIADPVAWGQDLRAVVGALTIDQDTFEIRDGGELLPLTPTEFRIVSYLASYPGLVRSAGQIMSSIHDYGLSELESRQTIRVYVRRIRRKLANCANQSVEIVSFRLKGYRLQSSLSVTNFI
jgi:DNA-binding response OmpR family regulator